MTAILVVIIVFGLVLIATESLNRMNKAAVAMFAGVSAWLLYIAQGNFFVMKEYPEAIRSFAGQEAIGYATVKNFIAQNIFAGYVVDGAQIVFFILSTMTIVEVLNNNGCFDFISEWIRTRRPRKLLWTLALLTFILSANLDNLTTACLMLGILHPMLQNDRMRRIYGVVIVLSASCGGAFTVIGDITSLKLWVSGLVTPTAYSALVFLPVTAALATTLYLLSRGLPSRLELVISAPPYRGDDTTLSRSQRLLMLFVGIGGLWFIPTLHRITSLPPFLGALCVLSLLWIIDELCNRQLFAADQMVRKRAPLALQYANVQNILFFIGLTLMFGALAETGALRQLLVWLTDGVKNIYVINLIMGVFSGLFGHVPTLLGSISLFAQPDVTDTFKSCEAFAAGGHFWPLLSYTTAVGGSLLSTGTIVGYLLMRMEGVTFRWYLRHITPKVFAGFIVGFGIFALLTIYL